MRELLYIFIGGGTGSVLRYFVSLLWMHQSLHPRFEGMAFPWPTFVANILGCLMIGVFSHLADRGGMAVEMRLMLVTGLCGGFTTFSTFSYEGVALLNSGHYSTYVLYVALSIVLGLAAAALPMVLGRLMA